MAKKTIENIDVSGKRVLMRVDFNISTREGRISDDRRIRMALASIRNVADRGGRLVLMSHLGRPKGDGPEAGMSLEPCASRLGELLGRTVGFVNDCVSDEASKAADQLRAGDVLVLENLRFHKEEKKGGKCFSRRLAGLGDIFCNDAFGTAHREDASMVAVPRAMASKPKVAGFLLQKEIQYLSDAITQPRRPFVAILGGAKVSDKISAITHLLGKVDSLLIGGAMAYTLMLADGMSVGKSPVEREKLDDAKQIISAAGQSRADLHLPVDHLCGQQVDADTETCMLDDQITGKWIGLDIGPRTVEIYESVIGRSQTIVWNGPMGAFEIAPFEGGTRSVAMAVASATKQGGATSIIGGGDSSAAVEQFGLADEISHVSTGGGASLAMLEGRSLLSVELLDEQ